jgi:uncharacterized protein (TIGR02145 family)
MNMKKRLIPFYLVSMLCVGMLLSCGGSGNAPVADSGGIAPKVQWDYRNNDIPLNKGGTIPSPLVGEGQGEGFVLRKVPLGVYKVRASILDTNNNLVSGFQQTKDIAPGESGTITFTSVPVGTYNVRLEGLDTAGTNILYTGQTNGVSVVVGQVAEPPVIARYTRSDNASPGSSGHSPANGSTNVPANTQISVQVSDADAGVDAASIILTVNGTDVTNRCSIFGTSDNHTIKYRNGDIIGTTTPATLDISSETSPKYQWAYDGNESNVATYGRLYTWYAATDSRAVCPTGWHLPTDAEWTTLTTYLGGESVAGGKLKEAGTTHWNSPIQELTTAVDSQGFLAVYVSTMEHSPPTTVTGGRLRRAVPVLRTHGTVTWATISAVRAVAPSAIRASGSVFAVSWIGYLRIA